MKNSAKKSKPSLKFTGSRVPPRTINDGDGIDEVTLIATVGTSPAVLTETVWELAHRDGIVPHRVVVVSTSKACDAIRQKILGQRPGKTATVWQELREALKRNGFPISGRLAFMDSAEYLIACTRMTESGPEPMQDIANEADHMALANSFLRVLCTHTRSPRERVIVSIAGGFKTMSALMLSCMTLVGRPSDRVTHVLVDDEFLGILTPEFFFPEQSDQELVKRDFTKKPKTGADGKPLTVQARNARLLLLDVPLVTFRDLFKRDFLDDAPTYERLVEVCRARQKLAAGAVVKKIDVEFLHDNERIVRIDGVKLVLEMQKYWVLRSVLEAAAKGEKWHDFPEAIAAAKPLFESHCAAIAGWDPKEIQPHDLSNALSDIRTEPRLKHLQLERRMKGLRRLLLAS